MRSPESNHTCTTKIIFYCFFVSLMGFITIITESPFAYFALFTILLGISFPLFSKPLNKEIVDIFYYCIAIIGAALLYSTQKDDRDLIKVKAAYSHYQATHKYLVEFKIDIDNKLTKTGIPYFENILKRVFSQSSVNNHYSSACTPPTNHSDCIKGLQYESISNLIANSSDFENTILKYEQEQIEDIIKGLVVELETDESFQEEILISAKDVYFLFYPEKKELGADNIIKEIEEIKERYVSAFKSSKKELKEMKEIKESNYDNDMFSVIWAYILCVALSLKLARHSLLKRRFFLSKTNN